MWVRTKSLNVNFWRANLNWNSHPKAPWPKNFVQAVQAFQLSSPKRVGTVVADGKELREFDGETYVMERALIPDISLVKAWRADKSGNLQFRLTARNFNPAVAMAGKLCIVEVEEIVETGDMIPDQIHLPGIYVHRLVLNKHPEKRIEKRTITEKAGV